MKINPKVIDILTEYNVPIDDGVTYLLSLFFGYNSKNSIPDTIKQKVHLTGIISVESKMVVWKIPLFEEGQEIDHSKDVS